jgi:hypothetical protein
MSEAGTHQRTNGESADGVQLTEDAVFEVLSNQRRRFVYHYLQHADDEPVDLRDLTTAVAAWEYEKEPDRLTAAERNRVGTALRQSHLPKMDEEGFVEFDRRRGETRLEEAAAEVDVYLDVVPRRDVPWSQYYLGLSVAHALAFAAAVTDVGVLSGIGPTSAGVFCLSTLAVSALVHNHYASNMRVGEAGAPPEVGEGADGVEVTDG